MVYRVYIMLSVKIVIPSWCLSYFNMEENEAVLIFVIGLIDETRYVSHIWEFANKQRVSRRYNSKLVQRETQEGNLVLIHVVMPAQ